MYSSMHFSRVCNPHDFDYINIQFDCIDIEKHDFNVAQISCFMVLSIYGSFFEMNLYFDGTHAYAEVTRSFGGSCSHLYCSKLFIDGKITFLDFPVTYTALLIKS